MIMAYILPSDVRQAMRKLPTSVTDSDIAFFIEKAEAYLNGLLGGVYVTPFADVPPLIKHLALDLTVFYFTESFYSTATEETDSVNERRYDRIMNTIESLLGGEITLNAPLVPSTSGGSQAAGFGTTNESEPIFTLELPQW
jgi:phage gp36-like protein